MRFLDWARWKLKRRPVEEPPSRQVRRRLLFLAFLRRMPAHAPRRVRRESARHWAKLQDRGELRRAA